MSEEEFLCVNLFVSTVKRKDYLKKSFILDPGSTSQMEKLKKNIINLCGVETKVTVGSVENFPGKIVNMHTATRNMTRISTI